ncbi:MAG: ABC transporter ATP-binding protein [Anaerolineaceae bacterium]|nr:ABC transporter ATP-binding protein [Anaerolineaceae bacterium]
MTPPILSLQHIHFRFHPHHNWVLKDLNLDLYPGQIIVVLGPNGVGKTTLLNISYGWYQPQSGTVLINQRDLNDYAHRELGQNIAIVSQRESTPYQFNILDYVLLGRTPYLKPFEMPSEEDVEVARAALKTTGLLHFAHRQISQLSGGELQLVFIARALAQQTRILLLDEITMHLDLRNQQMLMRLICQLRDQGLSILMTTHDPQVAVILADTVLLLNPSNHYLQGPPEEMIQSETLSRVYQTPIHVIDYQGRKLIDWTIERTDE